MLELDLSAHRGSFHLQVKCRLASDWTVIFGHSGAGKSTLLRLLAGLDRGERGKTAQGHVAMDGVVLTDTANGVWLAPGRRKAALVSQHLSVEANVAY